MKVTSRGFKIGDVQMAMNRGKEGAGRRDERRDFFACSLAIICRRWPFYFLYYVLLTRAHTNRNVRSCRFHIGFSCCALMLCVSESE